MSRWKVCISVYNRRVIWVSQSRALTSRQRPDRSELTKGERTPQEELTRDGRNALKGEASLKLTPKCHPERPHKAKRLCAPCYDRKRYVEKHGVKRFQRQIDSELRDELKVGYGGKCSWCGRCS